MMMIRHATTYRYLSNPTIIPFCSPEEWFVTVPWSEVFLAAWLIVFVFPRWGHYNNRSPPPRKLEDPIHHGAARSAADVQGHTGIYTYNIELRCLQANRSLHSASVGSLWNFCSSVGQYARCTQRVRTASKRSPSATVPNREYYNVMILLCFCTLPAVHARKAGFDECWWFFFSICTRPSKF